MSLSKKQLKLITSLQQKKYRQKYQLFIGEGVKLVNELIDSDFELEHLFVLENSDFKGVEGEEVTYVTASELKRISLLKNPNNVLGIFKIPTEKPLINSDLIVALDGINDPGNLGTIIRLCDWFGIKQLLCSKNTVDCYNSKVIQSTMGSITRVNINYVDLLETFKTLDKNVFTADMSGQNIYEKTLPKSGILVMGNEANGISKEIDEYTTNRLTIPRFGTSTESLNVATATAILLSEFRRIT